LTKIANDSEFDFELSQPFITGELLSVMNDFISSKNCEEEIRKKEELNFSRVDELNRVLDSIFELNYWKPGDVAKGLLSILEDKDFENDYYKLNIFFIFNMIDFDNISDEIFPGLRESEELEGEEKNSNAFEILLNDKNQLVFNEEIINLDELRISICDYMKKSKSKSIIVINIDEKSILNFYKKINNLIRSEISKIRNDYAVMRFNDSFENLDKSQQLVIKKLYPQKILIN